MTELRRNPRVPLDVDVEITHGSESVHGRAHDISLGGMFVETESVIPFGAKVTVSFRVPSEHEPLKLEGVVRWTRRGGIGLQFGACGVRETHAITEWVGPHSKR